MPEDFRLQPLDPDDTKMKNPELAFTDDVVKASFSKVNLWRLTWTLPWLTLRPLVESFSLGKVNTLKQGAKWVKVKVRSMLSGLV